MRYSGSTSWKEQNLKKMSPPTRVRANSLVLISLDADLLSVINRLTVHTRYLITKCGVTWNKCSDLWEIKAHWSDVNTEWSYRAWKAMKPFFFFFTKRKLSYLKSQTSKKSVRQKWNANEPQQDAYFNKALLTFLWSWASCITLSGPAWCYITTRHYMCRKEFHVFKIWEQCFYHALIWHNV